MSILDRPTLQQSSLADLHAIASELSVDGYRRLRRAELIEAIIGKQGGGEESGPAEMPSEDAPAAEPVARPTGRPTTRRRRKSTLQAAEESDVEAGEKLTTAAGEESTTTGEAESTTTGGESTATIGEESDASDDDGSSARKRRGRRGGGGRGPAREDGQQRERPQRRGSPSQEAQDDGDDGTAEGVVELLGGGTGFVRVDPPGASENDVYISAAQVKRCELVSGDRIAGPKRAPRRSERFASLVRVDTINDHPATEVTDGARFDDLTAAFPDERFRLGSEDPTIKAIEWLTPLGRGSRVTISGASRAGKTEALRRLAGALAGQPELQVSVALAGVRPEEISEWSRGSVQPAAAVDFGASADVQAQAVEPVIDQARRVATRGGNALVLIDTLDGLHPQVALKALVAARNIVGGGSLTVIATASAPIGGETTVIALDASLASVGRFPSLDLLASGTLRPELLVGETGAEAIAKARGEALEG